MRPQWSPKILTYIEYAASATSLRILPFHERMIAMTVLPRPQVSVTKPSDQVVDVTITRDGKGKTYRGEGYAESDRTKEVVGKILDDGHTAEWLPGKA